MLATKGSQEQLVACGLSTVGDQLKLKKIVELQAQDSAVESLPLAGWKSCKPSGKAISSELHRRIYNAKKKAVHAAVIRTWPGNSLPNFKKSSTSLEELSALVDELEEECSFRPVGFFKPQIRQHILDILNELRRHVRKGHDYTQVDKQTIKKKKVEHGVPVQSSDSSPDSQENESVSSGDTEILSGSSEEHSSNDLDGDSASNNNKCETSTVEELTLQSARVIITVMFSAIKFSDVSRQQISSAVKKFKLPCSTSNPSKNDMAVAVANAFIEQKYVKLIDSGKRDKITPNDVHKLKVF